MTKHNNYGGYILRIMFGVTMLILLLMGGTSEVQASENELVAEWHFDEGSGNIIIDGSGNGNNGNIYGASWTTDGKFGSALQFDGINDYVEVPDSPELSGGTGKNMTVLFWFKSNKPSGHIITKLQDVSYKDWSIMMGSWINGPPALMFYYEKDNPNNDMRFYGGTIQQNVWNHGAFTFEAENPRGANNAKLKQYLNGEKLDLNFWNDHPPYSVSPDQLYDMPDTSAPVSIGYSGRYYNSGYFSGLIDEIKIYSRVLSANEIKAEFEKGGIEGPIPVIKNPNDGDIVSGTITLEETTSETDIVSNLFEYSSDGVTWIEIGIDTDGSDGWTMEWDTTSVPNGNYYLRYTMRDADGNQGSSQISITVANQGGNAPILEIIKPGVIFDGTFNQFNYGTYPMIMEITSVDGLDFNGILHWPTLGDSKTKFKGKIDSILNQIWFTEYEQIQGSVPIVLNGNYYAELQDNTFNGYWNWPSGVKGGTFSITLSSTPSITVTSPNGGETWQAGTTQTIRWSYKGDPGADVKIELLKSGVVDHVITSSTPIGNSGSGSYDWIIPSTQTPDTDYQIRVTSTTNNAYTDISDGFTISAPTLSVKITSPKNDDKFSKSGMITFKGEVTGGTPEFTYTWILDAGTHVEKTNERYSEWLLLGLPLGVGEHKVKLQVKDSNNNVIESDELIFRVFDKLVAIIPVEFEDLRHQIPAANLRDKAEKVVSYYQQQSYGKENIGYELFIDNQNQGWYRISEKFSDIENTIYKSYPPELEVTCSFSEDCDLPPENVVLPDWYIWFISMEKTGLSIRMNEKDDQGNIKWETIKPENYDVGMIVFPVKSDKPEKPRSIRWPHVQGIPGGSAWVDSERGYGSWSHELGHAFYGLDDLDGKNDKGNIGNWGLMSLGHKNPPAPIILFNKIHSQWIYWKDLNDGTYPVVLINDKRMLEEGALRYKTNSGNVEYYIFEGRYPYDEIENEIGLEVNNPLKLEEGIQLYSVDQRNRVYFISRCWLDNTFCTGGPFGEALVKVTMVPGETRILDDSEVKFTTLKDNGELKIKIEEYIPRYRKIWNIEIFNLFNSGGGIPEYSNLDVDLVIVSSDGKKVGMDYITGVYHNNIKDAHTSGNILGGGPEWISIYQNIDANAYIDLTAELKELIKNDESLNVKVNARLIVYDENGNRKESVPIPININSENVDRQLTISLPIAITFLPPITTMEVFSLTDGSTLPIKFTARDKDINAFIHDESVKVTITDSTNHQIISFTYGTGTDKIRIDSTEEQYIVNLHTKNYALKVGETYTITVTFGDPNLKGYAITYFTLIEGGKAKGKGD